LVWPNPLIFIYPRWKVVEPQLWAYLPAVVAAGGIFLLWRQRNGRMRPIFFSAAYFIVSLFPVLGFFNVYFFRYSFVGDHLQYLASMGPLALAGSGIIIALNALAKQRPLLKPALCGALLCLLGALTWKQARVYRSLETLWRDTIDKNPASWIAQNNFAMLLQQQGQDDEAIAHFQQALELAPNIFEIHNNLGYALLVRGRVSESLPHLQKALEMEPDHAFVHHNLGSALFQSGIVDEAIVHLQKALKIDPGYLPAYTALGSALLQKGRVAESFAHLQKALEIDPNDKTAHLNLANTLLEMGRADEAVSHLEAVLTNAPDDAEAQKNMAWVLATSPESRIRDGNKAVQLAERANQSTNGRNLNTIITLAAAYAEAGRFPDAIQTAEAAMEVANNSGNVTLAEGIRAYIELFRAGYPFRDVRQ
jgi:tetratricopeptide (TPR) repeat protein